jgi:hypothetical protein
MIQDSSGSIVTGYELEYQSLIPSRVGIFLISLSSRQTLGPTKSPVQLFPWQRKCKWWAFQSTLDAEWLTCGKHPQKSVIISSVWENLLSKVNCHMEVYFRQQFCTIKSSWPVSCNNAELKTNIMETDCPHHQGHQNCWQAGFMTFSDS